MTDAISHGSHVRVMTLEAIGALEHEQKQLMKGHWEMFNLKKTKKHIFTQFVISSFLATAAIFVAGECVGAATPSLVDNNSQGTISGEISSPDTGWYNQVLEAGGCTATIIAPHLVLTASHCGKPEYVSYRDGTNFKVRDYILNPYLTKDNWPSWFVALNDAQKRVPGGRQDDWPAMHDHLVLYVPEITADWMATHHTKPAQVVVSHDRASMTEENSFWTVGLSGDRRHYGRAKFLSAVANSITTTPRDGYLTRDGSSGGYVQTRGGDSGGPTFWEGNSTYSFVHSPVLIGTTQNGPTNSRNDSSNRNVEEFTFGGDLAPIGMMMNMTANQRSTAAKNAMWLLDVIVDRDRDGISNGCDKSPDTSATMFDDHRLCEGPSNSNNWVLSYLKGPSAALLPPGLFYRPSNDIGAHPENFELCGIKTRSGWLVDKIELKYRPKNKFDWWAISSSNEIGGAGGGETTDLCTSSSIWAFNVWTENVAVVPDAPGFTPRNRLLAIQAVCADGTVKPIRGLAGGQINQGVRSTISCQGSTGSRSLQGLIARMDEGSERWITSVSPICLQAGAEDFSR